MNDDDPLSVERWLRYACAAMIVACGGLLGAAIFAATTFRGLAGDVRQLRTEINAVVRMSQDAHAKADSALEAASRRRK